MSNYGYQHLRRMIGAVGTVVLVGSSLAATMPAEGMAGPLPPPEVQSGLAAAPDADTVLTSDVVEGLLSHLPPHEQAEAAATLAEQGGRFEDVDRLVESTRSAISDGGFLAAARGFLSVPSAEMTLPEPTGASRDDLAALAHLPAEMQAPLADLVATVRAAKATLPSRSQSDVARAVAGLHAMLMDEVERTPDRADEPDGRDQVNPLADPVPGLTSPVSAATGATGPLSPAAQGLLVLAAGLDRDLPVVEDWVAVSGSLLGPAVPDLAAGEHLVEGCDVLDLTPTLCIGGTADNEHAANAELLIDLGGNDTYRNSAGGAPFVDAQSGDLHQISVNIDLDGDDVYLSPPPTVVEFQLGTHAVVSAQGAGVAGSLGLLVDTSGNDHYVAAAPAPTEAAPVTAALAQGAGSDLGVGALFDLDGSDHYLTEAPSGPGRVTLTAQGATGGPCAAGGALSEGSATAVWACQTLFGGLLVDGGGGDDQYEILGGEAQMGDEPPGESSICVPLFGCVPLVPSRVAMGQGIALNGAGVLYDDGGRDAFRLVASAAAPDRTVGDVNTGPSALAWGQGAQTMGSGHGFLLEGDGPTTYELRAEGNGPVPLLAAVGQGGQSSLYSGLAVLDDVGGDDRYLLENRAPWIVNHVVADDCQCDQAVLDLSGYRTSTFNRLTGQGAVADGHGVAMLRDRGGDDDYAAVADADLSVRLHDETSSPMAPPELTVAARPVPRVAAQGAVFSATGANAALVDGGGSDNYELTVRNASSADATSRAAGEPTVVVQQLVAAARARVIGQGGVNWPRTVGILLDGPGGIDRVVATVVNEANTSPSPRGAFAAAAWPVVQGASSAINGGVGGIVLQGDQVMVESHPSRPACPAGATRGSGFWTGCANQFGYGTTSDDPQHQESDWQDTGAGYAPNAIPRSSASLSFSTDSPRVIALGQPGHAASRDVPRLPATVTLTHDAGTPLPGVDIHFVLQKRTSARWVSAWAARAVTDDDGVATASLPLLGVEDDCGTPTRCWRVLATFDGTTRGEALTPTHAAWNLTVASDEQS